MINDILTKIIDELGATGLLVVGLYFLLFRPLKSISNALIKIQSELTCIRTLIAIISQCNERELKAITKYEDKENDG